MDDKVKAMAEKLLRTGYDDLPERERRIIRRLADRLHIAQDTDAAYDEARTFGQKAADKIASFGGSWTFLILFGAVLAAWIALNARPGAFDPFPFILLNLVLSTLAAIQAPIIMMSQNRQAAKDRLAAAHDYEVNLKAELEIVQLHEKLDAMQREHLELLKGIRASVGRT